MAIFVFLLVLAAIAGVLGAVLKAVVFLVLTVVLTITVFTWMAIRSARRSLERAGDGQAVPGSTTIHIGRVRREPPDPPGSLPAGRDDRY